MGTYRAVCTITHPALGGTGTNTWHLRTSGPLPGAQADIEGLMDIVNEFYFAVGGSFPSGTVVAWDGEAAGVGDSEGEFTEGTGWSGGFGAQLSPLPPANSVCINWRGASGDRSKRGRTFVGPLNVGNLESDGTLTSGVLTVMRNAASALVSASEGFDNGAIGVFSRQEQLFRDFVGSSVKDQFAVLRSRRD